MPTAPILRLLVQTMRIAEDNITAPRLDGPRLGGLPWTTGRGFPPAHCRITAMLHPLGKAGAEPVMQVTKSFRKKT